VAKFKMLKTKNVQIVDVGEWDDLVSTTYGKPYSFQQQDGCKERGVFYLNVPSQANDYENDTIPEEVNGDVMGVSFRAWLARDPDQKLDTRDEWARDHGLDLFWERNFYPDVQMIANDLYARGLIAAGNYAIDIDW
jgi:hypothetical protein